jgi:hypothetical protein
VGRAELSRKFADIDIFSDHHHVSVRLDYEFNFVPCPKVEMGSDFRRDRDPAISGQRVGMFWISRASARVSLL